MQRARGKILRDQSDHAESKRKNIKGSKRSFREQEGAGEKCIYMYLYYHDIFTFPCGCINTGSLLVKT